MATYDGRTYSTWGQRLCDHNRPVHNGQGWYECQEVANTQSNPGEPPLAACRDHEADMFPQLREV